MKKRCLFSITLLISLWAASASADTIFMHEWSDDELWSFDTSTNTQTLIGETGLTNVSSMSVSSDGTLYGITTVGDLYTFNTVNAATTLIGSFGLNAWEGLTFGLDGTLYGTGGGSIYTLDTNTAAATLLGGISNSDVDGLTASSVDVSTNVGTFSAGTLFGTDSNNLFALDPISLTTTQLGSYQANEALTFLADGSLFGHNFSDELYALDLLNGTSTLVANTGSSGFTALASNIFSNNVNSIPEPGTLSLVLLSLMSIFTLRRRVR